MGSKLDNPFGTITGDGLNIAADMPGFADLPDGVRPAESSVSKSLPEELLSSGGTNRGAGIADSEDKNCGLHGCCHKMLDIGLLYQPGEGNFSGDTVSFVDLSDSRAVLMLADVVGKGFAASMLGALLEAVSRNLLMKEALSPSELLTALNAYMAWDSDFLHNYFVQWKGGRNCDFSPYLAVTMLCIEFNFDKKCLRWANAGHEPFLVWWDGREPFSSWEEADGVCEFSLGIEPECCYSEHTIPFRQGLGIFAYTDGVTECASKDNCDDRFGEARLLSGVSEFWHKCCAEKQAFQSQRLADSIYKWVGDYTGGRFGDDTTGVVLRLNS